MPDEVTSAVVSLSNRSLSYRRIDVNLLPPTANTYVRHTRRGVHYLTEEAKHFQNAVAVRAMLQQRWRPTGLLGAVICCWSPTWVTRKMTPRIRDIDNTPKVAFDSAHKALGLEDCCVWEFHPFKAWADFTRTTIWLFDLGLTVRYHVRNEKI